MSVLEGFHCVGVVTQSVCYRLLTDRVSRQGPAIGRVRPFRVYPFNQLVFDLGGTSSELGGYPSTYYGV